MDGMNEDGDGLLTIGALARLTGVTVKTVRRWSDEGLLPPAARTPAGYRLYGPDAPARLETVRTLRELGIGTAEIRAVLHSGRTVADAARHWADALDAQIRTLRLRRAVLRAVAARGTAAEELPDVHRLARLTAAERRRTIEEFVTDALDGVAAPAYRAGLLAAAPDLPEDPAPGQLGAWLDLAEHVQRPEVRAALRRLAEYSARTTPAVPSATAAEDAARVARLMRERGEAALAAGVAADSPAAEPVVAELVAAWLPTQADTADPPQRDDTHARARLLEQLEAAAEPHIERYWQLMCAATGRPTPPRWDAAGAWTAAALRAHPRPGPGVVLPPAPDAQRALYVYERVAAHVTALVDAVPKEALERPTPCDGWTVRQLIDHMTWENLMITSIAREAPRTDRGADHLGADHAAAFRGSVAGLLAAFTGSGMLTRTYGPYEAPGALFAQQAAVELLAHGWDLARALGAPTGLAPEVADEVLAAARGLYGAAPRTEGGSFAPERPAPEGASGADRLAAYLGR
ncbi:MerR family transcriptional regulator [Streptomyces paromomycinus]|uniref:MerR family transcriptional regulator n=2 Tax=Streptomyces paromomycinus TaxID=92743 RepID=A0A401WBX6_STREY|nr:MerR family transcriptional regulator [Streptomyces paromomycinus]